jgi:3-deoxy-7-phosphoheptulonate synthase
MILILSDTATPQSAEHEQLMQALSRLPGIQSRVHHVQGKERSVTEVYLIGNTKALQIDEMQSLPGVAQVIRVSEEFRVLGRHKDDNRPSHFDYQGLRFGQDTLHVFAGLCAVDTPEHVAWARTSRAPARTRSRAMASAVCRSSSSSRASTASRSSPWK